MKYVCRRILTSPAFFVIIRANWSVISANVEENGIEENIVNKNEKPRNNKSK